MSEQDIAGLAVKAKLFRGLADPSRLAILEVLRDGPKSVMEIVGRTGLSQPNASGHLACLRDCGLVKNEQRGRYTYYSIACDRVEPLLVTAEAILAEVGLGIYLCTRY